MSEFKDTRVLEPSSHYLVHKIMKRMRECEKYNIDYDEYLYKRDFEDAIEILDCCLRNKDNPKIKRRG